MTDKPDYYDVLGLQKGASEDEIKKAHQKKVMKYHPDRNINKSAEEKAEAQKQFQLVTEALDVLTDPKKRETYDSYGHKGLANLAAGHSAYTGRSYVDTDLPPPKPVSVDDAFGFFDKRRPTSGDDMPKVADGSSVLSEDEAREARRRAREARRGQPPGHFADAVLKPAPVPTPAPSPAPKPVATPPVTKPEVKTTVGADFDDVRQTAARVKDGMERAERLGVEIPVETLEMFRDNLEDMLKTVNTALKNARKKPPSL